jgi:hypothetical protein
MGLSHPKVLEATAYRGWKVMRVMLLLVGPLYADVRSKTAQFWYLSTDDFPAFLISDPLLDPIPSGLRTEDRTWRIGENVRIKHN